MNKPHLRGLLDFFLILLICSYFPLFIFPFI
jgi:hypothetical protein